MRGKFTASTIDSFASVFAAVTVTVIIIVLTSDNPADAAHSFFTGVFSSPYYFRMMADRAALILTASLGAAIAIRSGSINLGGHGQIYTAACITAVMLQNSESSFILTFLTACAAGGLAALFSGLLKAYRGINELLTSFLFSAVVVSVIDSAIAGPLRDTSNNLLATAFIAENHRLSIMFPLSSAVPAVTAIILCIVGHIILQRTVYGKRFIIGGIAPEFAQYCGFSLKKITVYGMFVSGILHGAAGFFAVTSVYFTCHSGFGSSLGWDALSAALIGQSHPLIIIPASYLLSYIFTSCDFATLTNNFDFEMSYIVQAVLMAAVTARFGTKILRQRKFQ